MRHPYKTLKRRHALQWMYASMTITVLLLGWKYPLLGYVVVLAMLGSIISGLIAGRWFCGNLCPRGGFLERILSKISPDKPAPKWLHLTTTRIGMIIFLFAMIGLNASRNPTSWEHWGFVFWLVCLVTTIFGLILAYFFMRADGVIFVPWVPSKAGWVERNIN